MIASFSQSFIFIRTRKTASTSTEIVLGTVCDDRDIVTPIGVEDELTRRAYGGGPKNFCSDPGLELRYRQALVDGTREDISTIYREVMGNLRFHHHMSAGEIRQSLDPEFWQRAFKFAVDRHPYEKVVSLVYWRARNESLVDRTRLDDWIDRLIETQEYRNSDLYLIQGEIAVDRLLRYEYLETDLERVASELGVSLPRDMPHAKGQYRSDRRPAEEILRSYQKKRIQDTCVFEFEYFGYEE